LKIQNYPWVEVQDLISYKSSVVNSL